MADRIRTIIKDIALLLLAAAFAVAPETGSGTARAASAAAGEAAPVIEGFHDTLLKAARKSGAAQYETRRDMLDPAVRKAFDLQAISRSVLGAYWGKLTAEQQRTFAERFARNTIATYAGQFDGYSGERFTFVGEQAPQADMRVVETDLTTGAGEKHRFTYMLRKSESGWRIANILVDQVSQIAVQRSQYTTILRDQGFDGLIVKLDTLTDSMKKAS